MGKMGLIKKVVTHTKKKLQEGWEKLKRGNLVETTISLRTKDLVEEVKNLCKFNIKLTVLTVCGAVLTALCTMYEFGQAAIGYFSGSEQIGNSTIFAIVLCFFSIIVIILSIESVFEQLKMCDPVKFVNRIIKKQYETEEYTAIFIIKAIFENTPKILVFRSEAWNSFFLPYCHYDQRLSKEKIKTEMKLSIAGQLGVALSDLEIYDNFTHPSYAAIKKSPIQKGMSKINYRFYYIRFTNEYLSRKFLNNNIKHFSWKSKYELGKDIDTQLNNGDIVSIIDELGLINESKVAFQEKVTNSYEISSKYSIIWNITNECYYNCPICATNSGETCHCDKSYQDKINILLNLSSINGYIDKLDISGGDPLKNEDDRKIIKKANQILSYTDIKVTTTGEALMNLPIETIMETVKKCDITYDIPYKIESEEFEKYREYDYNYHNFRQLEKLSNSGINIELNIHIPILPVVKEEKMIIMILEDINRINPSEVKFIRFMPVGRTAAMETIGYSPEEFLKYVSKIIEEKEYKFNVTYNCSLGTRLTNKTIKGKTIRDCGMLKEKLGIDCNGRVFSCIWGAYIQEFEGDNYEKNPFYLGDLTKETMYEILTKPSTLKLLKNMEEMKDGCRVCAYVNERMNKKDEIEKLSAGKIMIEAEDPLRMFMGMI